MRRIWIVVDVGAFMINAKTRQLFRACALFITLVTACANAETTVVAASKPKSCAATLPAAVTEKLKTDYPDWKVLELSDLVSDDQLLWKTTWGEKACPGVTSGD